MKIKISSSFFPMLKMKCRYLVMGGGRGSGKSEFAARKLFKRGLEEPGHRFLILRKVRRTCRESVIEVFLRMLNENGVVYEYLETRRLIRMRNAAGKVTEYLFDGLDDPEKIKSIKGLTGIWIEEATEFTEKDFMTLDLCLREPGPSYHQIMLTFNPEEALAPWLKERFYDKQEPLAFVHGSTIDDNPIREVRELYRPRLDALKQMDETYYQIYRLGNWAIARGRIFNWDMAERPDGKMDEIFYGGDFGYSVNPAAVVRIFRKADEYWLEEVVYATGLTNDDLAEKMTQGGVGPDDLVYFDAAEPKSIEELRRKKINALATEKGPDSVRASIDYLKSKKIHIIYGSENLSREARTYKWREDRRSGRLLNEPVKFDDHGMDAVRGAIFSHCSKPQPMIYVIGRKKHDQEVRP